MTQANNTASYNYKGATILITGGSNGIGFATASAFADSGASVIITGTKDNASDYENDLSRFQYHQLLVQDREAIYQLAEKIPQLDILMNNAGTIMPGGKDEYDPIVFEEAVRINLFSAYHCSKAFQEQLAASELSGGASIMSTASLTSILAVPMVPGYSAAKAALVQMSKTLATAWADQGIRVNSIIAGMIDTRMTEFMKDIPDINDPIMTRTPLKRWGTPEDIANGALFLASQQASFITGQTLVVDGGYSIVG